MMRVGRLIALAVAIEAIGILVLILAVAMFGPPEPGAARDFAQRLGYWLGPTAGFVLCLGGGWLAARRLTEGHVGRGLLVGALVAAIDIAILIAGGAAFQPILALSNLGRVLAGSLGGLLASRTSGA